jgi:hypothetical protein
MRMILLASMMTMAAATANAESSIDIVKTSDVAPSIDHIRCTACAPMKSKKVAVPDVVLKPGTQKVEIKQVNGELKVFRTEAWLGGSPVTYVSKASTDLMDKQSVASANDQKIQPTATEDKSAAKDKTVVVEDKTAATATDADQGAKTKVSLNKDAAPAAAADMSGSSPKVTIDNNTTSSTNADLSGGAAPAAAPKMVQHFNPQDLQLRLK